MATVAETLRRKFWLLPALGVAGGLALGYLIVEVDDAVDVDFGVFSFADYAAARDTLSTIGTAMMAVVGVAFTVTLVALQLSSSQLSPRVLTTFREDQLTQGTLAAFLGTFAYALVVMGRLREYEQLPEISLSLAMLLALTSVALFVAFVGKTVASLQASTVIARIADDGRRSLGTAHPRRIGDAPDDGDAAGREIDERRRAQRAYPLRASRGGYLIRIEADALIDAARRHDALVVQDAHVGDLVITGQIVARAHVAGVPSDDVLRDLEAAFRYGIERRAAQDVGFPIRSLADVALRALSPSVNDPTTAENALGTIADIIVSWIERGAISPVRVDDRGRPRLLARVADLDELVELGFEQARLMVAGEHPFVAERVIRWLDVIAERAVRGGHGVAGVRRQIELLERTAERAPG